MEVDQVPWCDPRDLVWCDFAEADLTTARNFQSG